MALVSGIGVPADYATHIIDIASRLSSLAGEYDELAGSLTGFGYTLEDEGVPPSKELCDLLCSVRTDFLGLEAAVRRCATEFAEANPILQTWSTETEGLWALKDRVAMLAEIHSMDIWHRVQSVAQYLLHLQHGEMDTFPPLGAMQEQASLLLERLSAIDEHFDRDDISTPLEHSLALEHDLGPFMALRALVEGAELADQDWLALPMEVAAAFSPPIAVAAARGKLLARRPNVSIGHGMPRRWPLGSFCLPTHAAREVHDDIPCYKAKQVLSLHGSLALVITEGGAKLIDLETGECQFTIECPATFGVLQPAGDTLALIKGGDLAIWSLGREISC